METTIERIPTWALCSLIYGDNTGLTDEEIAMIENWSNTTKLVVLCSADEEPEEYFTTSPAFGLACNVIDCSCLITE